ncbi:MAG: LacI family DNA-binding transcriptional regulator [Lysobacterales bacterium]|jgi:LacI family transcriptional regulator|nr:MAG: LacI family DNA-binding transcriptional regulator [Xanthomonadales bacterium]
MSTRRTSINDVAKAAGVAIKTVSRVLNNEPNVREETRAQVLAAVKRLNYHPSLSARSLASRRSYLVGLVYDNPSANYTIEVQRGALARCREGKFLLLLHEVAGRGDELIKDILAFANRTHLDGLIITPPLSESAELIRVLDAEGPPFVRIAPNDLKHRSPYVDIDDEGAAREMTEYLIGLGHRRIAFIIGRPGHHASGERLKGYKAALKAHRIPYAAEYVRQGDFLFDSGLDAARQLLALPKRPTAIFAANDDMAAGALMAAHEMGVAVPAQLSVAGFDDAAISRTVWPPLTTILQPTYDLSYKAAELLLQTLLDGAPSKPVRLAHRLICRASTDVAPAG